MSEIRTADELDALPLGSLLTDKTGDVWIIDTHLRHGNETYLIGPETGSMASEIVAAKWGPLTLHWRPDQQPTAQPTAEALAAVLDPRVVTHHHGCHEPADEDWGPSLSTKTPAELAAAVLALLPGRPESVVKAEALREAAEGWRHLGLPEQSRVFAIFLDKRADHIEGEQR